MLYRRVQFALIILEYLAPRENDAVLAGLAMTQDSAVYMESR